MRICRELLARIGELTRAEEALRSEIATLIRPLAPGLLAVSGIDDLIAARLIVEIGGAERFKNEAAPARHAGSAQFANARVAGDDTGANDSRGPDYGGGEGDAFACGSGRELCVCQGQSTLARPAGTRSQSRFRSKVIR